MNHPGRFRALLVLLAIPVAALVISWWVQTRGGLGKHGEPSWHGRSLGSWLKDIDIKTGKRSPQAESAIRGIGTNGIAFLLAQMTATNTPRDHLIAKVGNEERRWKLGLLTTEERRWFAASAFETLGSAAEPAIPDLLRMLGASSQPSYVSYALSRIGTNAIAPLTHSLANTNERTRMFAVMALQQMGPTAASAAAALARAARDPADSVRSQATRALGRCKGDPAVVVPALLISLNETNRAVQILALDALGQVGPPAIAAVPAIAALATNSSSGLDTRASAALKRIDPGEAARLGVK